MVEHQTLNLKVGGSSPPAPAILEAKSLIGKTFKIRKQSALFERSRSGLLQRVSWWNYVKVKKLDPESDGALIVFEFETDPRGTFDAATYCGHRVDDRHIPITATEFNKAWRAFQKKIANVKP